MSYQTRKTLFEQIENSRQRPLISYVTSIRPNLSGNMTGDSIDQIIAQIQKIPEDKKEIDFLIISNGGDPITALLRIVQLPYCLLGRMKLLCTLTLTLGPLIHSSRFLATQITGKHHNFNSVQKILGIILILLKQTSVLLIRII